MLRDQPVGRRGHGPGGACAEADGEQCCGASFGKACCGSSGCLAVRLVPWWLSGEMGRKGSRQSVQRVGAVGLRHKWQPFEMDSVHRRPPGEKVVGDLSTQPVGGWKSVQVLSTHPLERYCERPEQAQSAPRSRCPDTVC